MTLRNAILTVAAFFAIAFGISLFSAATASATPVTLPGGISIELPVDADSTEAAQSIIDNAPADHIQIVEQTVQAHKPVLELSPIVTFETEVAPAPQAVTTTPAVAPPAPKAIGNVLQDVLDPVASAAISVYNGKAIPMPAQQSFDGSKPLNIQASEAAELFLQTTVTADANACDQDGFNAMVACEAAAVDAHNGDAVIAPITVSNRFNPATVHSVEPLCGQLYSINYCEGSNQTDHINLNRTAFDSLADHAPADRADLMMVILAHEDGHNQDQSNGHIAGVDFLEWATTDKNHAEERVYPMEKSADTHAGVTYRAAVDAGAKTPESYNQVSQTMTLMGGDTAHGTGEKRFNAFTGVDTIGLQELLTAALQAA